MIKVKKAGHKGRGVFAQKKFRRGQTIEVCPVIVCKNEWKILENTTLGSYVYEWGNPHTVAIALGMGSLYNHSKNPNVEWYICEKTNTIKYIATRTIQKHEEMLLNYGYTPDGYDPKLD